MIRSAIPTIDGTAHSAGDAMGSVMTFDFGAFGTRDVTLEGVEILDDAASPDSADLTLYLFTDSDVAVADNAAFTISQADYAAGKVQATTQLTSYAATPIGTNAAAVLASVHGINRFITLTSGKIYGQLVNNAGVTIAANQLVVQIHIADYE